MKTILIVCMGNLCRSPMAAGLLQARLSADPERKDWVVRSAGTWAEKGRPASSHAVEVMQTRDIDIDAHRSQPVSEELLAEADLVLTMTRDQAEGLQVAFPRQRCKVFPISVLRGGFYDIADPYGGALAEYEQTAAQLEHLIELGYERLEEMIQRGCEE